MMKFVEISWLRMLAMASIICCHLMQYYDCKLMYIFNVGVQVFFIISGFLYAERTDDISVDKLGSMFKKILIPYWVFVIPVLIVYVITQQPLEFCDVVGCLLAVRTLDGIEHLWFIPYLLFCYLLLPYLYKLKISTMGGGKIILVILICNIVAIFLPSHFDPSCISCFVIGYFYKDLAAWISRHNSTTIVVSVLTNAMYFFTAYRYRDVIDTELLRYLGGYTHLLLGLIVFHYGFIVLKQFIRVREYSRLLLLSDKYSYPIYIVHQLFILSPFSLMSATRCTILNVLIALLSVITCGYLILFVSNVIFAKRC